MPRIIVYYPKGKMYWLNVSDADMHIYHRVKLIDGGKAANHLAQLWVGSLRTKRAREKHAKQQNLHVTSVKKEAFCYNRACYACGNHDCKQRVCEEK